LLRFFRTVGPAGLLLLLLYTIAFAVHVYLYPVTSSQTLTFTEGLLYHRLLQLDRLSHPWNLIPALLLLLITAYLLALASARSGLSHHTNLFPALAFIGLFFLLPDQPLCLPGVLPATLLILMWLSAVRTYNTIHADRTLFDVGLLAGILSWLQPTYLLLLPVAVFAVVRLRTLGLRQVLVILSGTLLVHFLLDVLLYFFYLEEGLLTMYSNLRADLVLPSGDLQAWIQVSVAVIYVIGGLFFTLGSSGAQPVFFRRASAVWVYSLVATVLLFILQPGSGTGLPVMMIASGAVFTAWWWQELKNREAASILFISLLALVFVCQYITFT
jgi:hypothetical protein